MHESTCYTLNNLAFLENRGEKNMVSSAQCFTSWAWQQKGKLRSGGPTIGLTNGQGADPAEHGVDSVASRPTEPGSPVTPCGLKYHII